MFADILGLVLSAVLLSPPAAAAGKLFSILLSLSFVDVNLSAPHTVTQLADGHHEIV